jgi:hypothetical protein
MFDQYEETILEMPYVAYVLTLNEKVEDKEASMQECNMKYFQRIANGNRENLNLSLRSGALCDKRFKTLEKIDFNSSLNNRVFSSMSPYSTKFVT